MKRVSLLIPCYNEEPVLQETTKQLTVILDNLLKNNKITSDSFILYINDGSKDSTWKIISTLHQKNRWVCGLNLSRNKGHQNALLAGMHFVKDKCDVAISMDADLQDDTSVIEAMIDCYMAGNDVVYGVRSSRDTDTLFKRWTAMGFYKLMNSLGVDSVYNHADCRLMSRRALVAFSEYKEKNLFLRGLVPLVGYTADKVYYDRNPRFAGESKYPLVRMLAFAIDGITSFSIKPLRVIFYIGLIIMLISFIAIAWVLYQYTIGNTITGWSSLLISVWFLGSMILMSIGVAGEYIGKIYIESKSRPSYHIESTLMKNN